MRQVVYTALSPESLYVSGHQLVVLRMGRQSETGLFYFFQSAHKLCVVGTCETFELGVTALGSLVEEGFIGHHALVGQRLDLLRELSARCAEEAEIHTASLLAQVHTAMEYLGVVLRRNGNRMLEECGTSARCCRSRAEP